MMFPVKAGLSIPGECRYANNSYKKKLFKTILSHISIIQVTDKKYPEIIIESASNGFINRILLAPVASGKSNNGSWSEDIVDNLFKAKLSSECVFCKRNLRENDIEVVCIGPYSRYNRRWLREYSILNGMPSVGFTSIEDSVSLVSDMDCDYTIIVGSPSSIKRFDEMCGGSQALCSELLAGLKANDDHYGDRNPFAFMSTYFPDLAGCGKYRENEE